MCKVLIIPKVTDQTRAKAKAFVMAMSKRMSTTNDDGLGYAAVDAAGNLFGERWLVNKDFYTVEQTDNAFVDATFGSVLAKSYWSGNTTKGEYNNFGDAPSLDKMTAITLHTRMATSGKGHKNTHPFYNAEADTSLIHNGIISNVKDFKLKLSTCDSETILISYLNNKVNVDPWKNVGKMADQLVGYYACGVFSRDDQGFRVLDIFKAHNSNFHVSWINELDTYVFSSQAFDINEACKELGFTNSTPKEVSDGTYIRIYPGQVAPKFVAKFTEGKRSSYYSGNTSTGTSHYNPYGEYEDTIESVAPTCNLPGPTTAPFLATKPPKSGMTLQMIDYMKRKATIIPLSVREEEEFYRQINGA